MSVGRKTGNKPLAFVTSLMVLFAMVVPFLGTALAAHDGDTDPDQVTMTPDTDSAAVGTCNEFTVSTRNSGAALAGETVDIRAYQQDTDIAEDLQIAFCDPDAGGPASNLGGAQPDPASGQQTGNGAAATDCDDDGGVINNGTCPTATATAESQAEIRGECFTNAQGTCTFGVTSNEAGTMTVEAFYERGGTAQDGVRDTSGTGDPFDTSTKTWTGSGPGSAKNITCTPATDSNPDGSRHEFQCTVTDANGTALQGVQVSFDVTAGPNAEEVNRTNCGQTANNTDQTGAGGGTTTNSSGQTAAPAADNPPGSGSGTTAGACGYNDNLQGANNSLPGTDTITAYVNLGPQPGQPAPTSGPDAGEPVTTIQKTWVGQERVIDCEPETASNQVGTSHTVTCTVTDAGGRAVQGARVDFTETGPATPDSNAAVAPQLTNANGQASFTIQTGLNDAEGSSTVRGSIAASPGTECAQAAGTPAGAPAGVCFDDVTKTWTRTRPTPAQCNDGVDNDADGRVDFPNDPGCADISDNTESPDPEPEPQRTATNLTIRYDGDANAFKGAAGSSRKACQRGRTVLLKKVTPGPNATVGRDTTNRVGNWRISKSNVNGRYYAIVLKKNTTTANGTPLVCLRDRSVTIKL